MLGHDERGILLRGGDTLLPKQRICGGKKHDENAFLGS
jgi:hypothetical protein